MSKRRVQSVFDCQNAEMLRAVIAAAEETAERARYELARENARELLRSNTKDRIKALERIPEYVAVKIADGMDADAAIREVAEALDTMEETVRSRWRRACREQAASARELRNGRIWQLAAAGCSNDEIGKAVELHPVTISRIIKAMKKRRAREGMHTPR